MSLFIPRFNCELYPIERCWCQAKRFTQEYSNESSHTADDSFEGACALISSFFLTCKDFEKAYKEGHTSNSVDKVVKEYKSYRRMYVGVTAGKDGFT